MKNFKIAFITLLFFILLTSCSDFKKIMTGQKVQTTDEFLVKKKDPLILPPKHYELPLPNSKQDIKKNSSIESMIGSSKGSSDDPKNKSNLEKMILNELRK